MFQFVAVGPRSIAVHLREESGSILSLPCDQVVADNNKIFPLPFFFQPGQTQLSQLLPAPALARLVALHYTCRYGSICLVLGCSKLDIIL